MVFRLSLLLLLVSAFVSGEDWNQWRGPNRDGSIETREKTFPDSLKQPVLTKVWNAPLAEGYSSPIISGDRVFTFGTHDKEFEIAKAFNLASGELMWEKKWTGSMKVPFFAAKNGSWVRATPACDGKSVYFCGMRDVMVKLDADTGDEIWRIDFIEREGTELPSFGYISSPLIDDGFLYVQAGSAVAKLNADTGENIWRVLEDKRAMFGNAFSSPVLADIHGKPQLIVQNRMSMAGLNPQSGEVLWTVPVKAFRGMNILTPTIKDNLIFTASYGGGAMCFEISADNEVKTLWKDAKLEGYMGSPQLIDGNLYLHGRDKKLHCVAMTDGKKAWSSEEEFGEYWSMVHHGNRILALDQKGEVLLFDANPEKFEILDRRKLSKQSTWAHVAVAGEYVVVRGLKEITVYRWALAS